MTASRRAQAWRAGGLAFLTAWMGLMAGCSAPDTPKLPFRAPILGEPPGDQLLIDDRALALRGDVRRARFGEVEFRGYRVFGGQLTTLDIALRQTERGADPVLVVYGPRQDGDIWGRPIAVDDDGAGGVNARLSGFRLPVLGEYLIVATSRVPAVGEFELALLCTAGCENVVPCPELACSDAESCLRGFRNDARGCATCDCMDECEVSPDCGPGHLCERGACRDDCFCPDELDLICGEDGVTYANACEAACAGVAVAAQGECPNACELTGCALSCPQGYRLGEDGCPTCACLDPCEQCDEVFDPVCTQNGATYTNPCLAQCNGEEVAYVGECIEGCPPFVCELECPTGFARDDDGCQLCACDAEDCPQGDARVCGVNGVTYATECERLRAGIAKAYEGSCGRLCRDGEDCPDAYSCVELGSARTECVAGERECVGNCIAPERASCRSASDCLPGYVCDEEVCLLECQCSPQYNPVCGDDGETYSNACVARCARARTVKTGACCADDALDGCALQCDNGLAVDVDGCEVCACREDAPCECQPVDNPVCGEDGATYRNACEARCVGVARWSDGACP